MLVQATLRSEDVSRRGKIAQREAVEDGDEEVGGGGEEERREKKGRGQEQEDRTRPEGGVNQVLVAVTVCVRGEE